MVAEEFVKWLIGPLAVNGAVSCRLASAALIGCSLATDSALIQDHLEKRSVFVVQRVCFALFEGQNELLREQMLFDRKRNDLQPIEPAERKLSWNLLEQTQSPSPQLR